MSVSQGWNRSGSWPFFSEPKRVGSGPVRFGSAKAKARDLIETKPTDLIQKSKKIWENSTKNPEHEQRWNKFTDLQKIYTY